MMLSRTKFIFEKLDNCLNHFECVWLFEFQNRKIEVKKEKRIRQKKNSAKTQPNNLAQQPSPAHLFPRPRSVFFTAEATRTVTRHWTPFPLLFPLTRGPHCHVSSSPPRELFFLLTSPLQT